MKIMKKELFKEIKKINEKRIQMAIEEFTQTNLQYLKNIIEQINPEKPLHKNFKKMLSKFSDKELKKAGFRKITSKIYSMPLGLAAIFQKDPDLSNIKLEKLNNGHKKKKLSEIDIREISSYGIKIKKPKKDYWEVELNVSLTPNPDKVPSLECECELETEFEEEDVNYVLEQGFEDFVRKELVPEDMKISFVRSFYYVEGEKIVEELLSDQTAISLNYSLQNNSKKTRKEIKKQIEKFFKKLKEEGLVKKYSIIKISSIPF